MQKSFWLNINNTDPPDCSRKLSAGNEVGDISSFFLEGEQGKMAEITKEYIEKGITSIYEIFYIR